MKNTRILYFIILLLVSCSSDKLTNSQVKELIEECISKEKAFNIVDVEIVLGNETVLNKALKPTDTEEIYLKLSEEGLVNIKKLETNFLGYIPMYNISLTDEGKKHITKIEKKSFTSTWVKCFTLEIDDIKEIHEIPSENIAKVKVTFRKENKTPFMILLNDELNNDDLIKQTITFKKTNKGWRLCE